jgi:hypothetical protein
MSGDKSQADLDAPYSSIPCRPPRHYRRRGRTAQDATFASRGSGGTGRSKKVPLAEFPKQASKPAGHMEVLFLQEPPGRRESCGPGACQPSDYPGRDSTKVLACGRQLGSGSGQNRILSFWPCLSGLRVTLGIKNSIFRLATFFLPVEKGLDDIAPCNLGIKNTIFRFSARITPNLHAGRHPRTPDTR